MSKRAKKSYILVCKKNSLGYKVFDRLTMKLELGFIFIYYILVLQMMLHRVIKINEKIKTS